MTTFNFSQVKITNYELEKMGDVYPNMRAPIVYVDDGRITLAPMDWSMHIRGSEDPKVQKQYSTFNAVSEEIDTKKTYREQWVERKRCIIPAIGFYEHRVERDSKRKVYIRPSEKGILCIAGLWDDYRSFAGPAKCFTMLTCVPNEQMKRIHGRMPVIIQNWRAYLDPRTTPEQAKTLCKPFGGQFDIDYAHF
ncbi:SOS response-associated peptidase [Bdellovibrio bacteriovorus]|uniref:SOS response-associated peptidase n=1 Tax=Bdellovibrio bacteriovorus TaxID=959 RepID=UPI0035A6841B